MSPPLREQSKRWNKLGSLIDSRAVQPCHTIWMFLLLFIFSFILVWETTLRLSSPIIVKFLESRRQTFHSLPNIHYKYYRTQIKWVCHMLQDLQQGWSIQPPEEHQAGGPVSVKGLHRQYDSSAPRSLRHPREHCGPDPCFTQSPYSFALWSS